MKTRWAWALGLVAWTGLTAYGQGVAATGGATEPEVRHWEVGTRITHYTFRDSTQGRKFEGSFIGSLTKLKEDQDYLPTKVFVQYLVAPCWGVGASYEHVEAETWDSGGTDGTVELDGAILYLTGRLPQFDLFRPYGEIGLAYFASSFDYDPVWYDGGRHIMELDDSMGISLALGADVLLSEQWALNLMARYTEADVDAEVFTAGHRTAEGNFRMDHFSFGVGAKYAF